MEMVDARLQGRTGFGRPAFDLADSSKCQPWEAAET